MTKPPGEVVSVGGDMETYRLPATERRNHRRRTLRGTTLLPGATDRTGTNRNRCLVPAIKDVVTAGLKDACAQGREVEAGGRLSEAVFHCPLIFLVVVADGLF